jgi:hypothetical protein
MTPQDDPSFESKLINYLLAVISQSSQIREQRKQPDFVPCRIKTPESLSHYVAAGEHDCVTNVWGAIFLPQPNEQRMGVFVHECEILALVPNKKKQILEREQRESRS